MEKIHLIAPGKYCGKEVIQNGRNLLLSFGKQVIKGGHVFGQSGYFSGTDEERTEDFLQAIQEKNAKVFFGRGGYGAVKVLEMLPDKILEQQKPIIYGYSDATVFHLKMNQLNCPSVHCPMALDVPALTKQAKDQIKKVLDFQRLDYSWQGHTMNQEGTIESEIVGGNLAVIASMMGSQHLPDFKGKVLFIEEIGEAFYAIDRLMMMLRLNGILSELAGLMVGQFTAIGDSDPSFEKSVPQIISDYVKEYNYPVCYNIPVGHINDHQSIYFGVNSSLQIQKNEVKLFQDPKR